MNIHPSKRLVTCDGDRARIDVEMIPVVTALWRRDVHTCNGTCQGDPGEPAFIAFPDIGQADRFCWLVMNGGAGPDLVSGSDYYPNRDITAERLPPAWKWSMLPRFPLIIRCAIRLDLPNDHLDQVAAWIAAASPDSLDVLPKCPEDGSVSPNAGRSR